MARKYDLLVFDWDGTVLDSTGAIVRSFQAACRDVGVAAPPDELAREVIGLGLNDALRVCVPRLTDDQLPSLIERYRFHYLSGDGELQLFPGMAELLANLVGSGYSLAIATGKGRLGLERALSNSGLRRFFAGSRCADECSSKPDPQMLLDLMAEFSAAAGRTLMIGDTTHDLQMAINAGVDSLAVTYGAHRASALAALKPLARFDTVGELSAWLRTHA